MNRFHFLLLACFLFLFGVPAEGISQETPDSLDPGELEDSPDKIEGPPPSGFADDNVRELQGSLHLRLADEEIPLGQIIVFGVPAEGTSQETPDSLDPGELVDKFEKVEDPPLRIGVANDRVRELQASLNLKLEGQTVILGQPIFVGPPRGPSTETESDSKNKVRLVYSPRRKRAFQIRGDWMPLDEDKKPLEWDSDDVKLKPTSCLKLPKTPLKVDGVYGQHTQAAVAVFQLQQALPVTGEVDVVTLDKLEPMVPTNPLLAVIMHWVRAVQIGPFQLREEDDGYAYWVKTFTSLIVMLLILAASAVVFRFAHMLANSTRFLSRWLFTPSSSPWLTSLRENKVFLRTAQFTPALFIYIAGLTIFPASDVVQDRLPYLNTFQNWHTYVTHFGLAYASLVLMLVAFAVAKTCESVFNPDQTTENPIGGIIRASKRLIGLIGALLILASLAGKNPFYIVGGLGAFMAVFMLVFRDYLLGLTASIQIIANKMVKVGDWIAMPKYHADGDVQEISLTLIKVRNFDKTISTIPTHVFLTESFRNWTGMQTAGGRRIKRAIHIDVHSIQVCTPEMIERFGQIELIRDYIQQKKTELEEYNRTHDIDASMVNSRRLTNIGTFRAYLEAYLRNHPGLREEMTFLVRHLQPTGNGLPIEIYAFCRETVWEQYEAIQADIFDHVLAILTEFGLQAFQEITDTDPNLSENLWPRQLQDGLAEIESMIEAENRELSNNPRTRLISRVQRINKRIAELGLSDHVEVGGSGRTITLWHLRDN